MSKVCAASCFACVGMILVVILVPMSFSGVDYCYVGLKYQRSTAKIHRDKVYGPGKYAIGPDYAFKTYRTCAQLVDFSAADGNGLNVWTLNDGDVSSGSGVVIDISIQYRLRADDVGRLHSMVGLNYKPLVRTRTVEAVKNTAPLYTLAQYLGSRQLIEDAFAANVSVALDTVFADLIGLQLRAIQFPSEVTAQRLRAAVQQENNDKELYLQQASLIRSQTAVEVKKIENDALTVAQQAVADAGLVEKLSVFESQTLVDTARNQGMLLVYNSLNITSDADKASLQYLLALGDSNDQGRLQPWLDFANANVLAN